MKKSQCDMIGRMKNIFKFWDLSKIPKLYIIIAENHRFLSIFLSFYIIERKTFFLISLLIKDHCKLISELSFHDAHINQNSFL